MQLGFVTAILPDLTLEEVLQFAAATGYDCVEVMCWPKGKAERRYAGVTHVDVAGFDAAAAAQVRGMAERHGVVREHGAREVQAVPDERCVCLEAVAVILAGPPSPSS